MEGRRFAQLLFPGRRAVPPRQRPQPHPWAYSASPWRRLLARSFATIIERAPPAGAGSAAAALLLLASATYGAVRGDHVPNVMAQVQDIADSAANAAGFGISEIALSGVRGLSREDVLSLAGITGRSSLLFLDAATSRQRLVDNPWVAEATVLKLYPGRLRIEIKERAPFALWQKDGTVSVVAEDGKVLEPYVPARFAHLPVVVGQGAEHAAPDFLARLARYPGIAQQVRASALVAQRRWTLYLKNGVEVMLPEFGMEEALRSLVAMDRDERLLARDIVLVDLRTAGRVTVRLSDAAAAARDEALKAAEKERKKKKKGSEA